MKGLPQVHQLHLTRFHHMCEVCQSLYYTIAWDLSPLLWGSRKRLGSES